MLASLYVIVSQVFVLSTAHKRSGCICSQIESNGPALDLRHILHIAEREVPFCYLIHLLWRSARAAGSRAFHPREVAQNKRLTIYV